MAEKPWTPGPWHYRYDKYEGDAILAAGPRWVLRRIDDPDTLYMVPYIPNQADAHLIAAGPDVVEALERLVTLLTEDTDFLMSYPEAVEDVEQAHAALAKAYGREPDQ